MEKEMATHSSILAWRIPWTEEPGRLQATGSQRVGHGERLTLSLSRYSAPLLLMLPLSRFTCDGPAQGWVAITLTGTAAGPPVGPSVLSGPGHICFSKLLSLAPWPNFLV